MPKEPVDPSLLVDIDRELDDIDRELTEKIGPIDPQVFFKLGQAVPGAETAEEAVSTLFPTGPKYEEYPSLAPEVRPFQGAIIKDPSELEEIIAEQIRETPTHRLPDRGFARYELTPLTRLFWFPLSEYENHPRRNSFRSVSGHGTPPPAREVPLNALFRSLMRMNSIDWVTALVFADEPYLKVWPPSPRFNPLVSGPQQVEILHTRFRIAYIHGDLEGTPPPPEWLVRFIEAAPGERGDETL